MPAAHNMVDTAREDPLVGFHFAVEIQGMVSGYFTECSGLGSENEVIEHKVVNEKGVEVVLKIPGRLKWENIVLKRGITSNMDIWEWRKMVEDGDVAGARQNGSVVMYDQTLAEVARWNFENAWPVKVTGPSVKSDGNEIGVEELTIAHEFIERLA
ncbi:MAG: phage tail protein [Anaerolineales bacterium]|nr:phage tail protein [Anaerolineales bacterium]MCB0007184.1 phage tail protein [Anaerolineales bacterium]MCB0010835.1 phage tail protein [Anaerolineales bacterium]MCB0017569.1 phage tail protein [Anaerolineales bacterium]MCB0028069.1 phage tail protein [Anaerolineales bacterium]